MYSIQDRIRAILFEQQEMSQNPYLQLKKENVSDEQLKKYFGMRPGEINIILSRVVEFLTDDHPGKTKRQVITEILEVLGRSIVARTFVGIGLKDNYRLFKGFPVRKGDPLSTLPDPGSEVHMTPQDAFISWTSDGSKAREIAVAYDQTKGDPIGGLLVITNVDSSKLLFDINAVINAVKAKKQLIDQYNNEAAPGKSLSKTNTTFLATKAPYYAGPYEVIIPNKYSACKVEDKWVWKMSGDNKKIEWTQSDKKDTEKETQVQVEEDETEDGLTLMNTLFESVNYNMELDEGMLDFIRKGKDFISRKTGAGVRGKSLQYLDTIIKQYQAYKNALEYALKFAKIQNDTPTAMDINAQIQQLNKYLDDAASLLSSLEQNSDAELNLVGGNTK
jgi:hypothetical protein